MVVPRDTTEVPQAVPHTAEEVVDVVGDVDVAGDVETGVRYVGIVTKAVNDLYGFKKSLNHKS